jgi:hypothetical protein
MPDSGAALKSSPVIVREQGITNRLTVADGQDSHEELRLASAVECDP